MNIDLPPSSAFAPDPGVARRGAFPPHTLTLPRWRSQARANREPMSGSISARCPPQPSESGLCATIASATPETLTITF